MAPESIVHIPGIAKPKSWIARLKTRGTAITVGRSWWVFIEPLGEIN